MLASRNAFFRTREKGLPNWAQASSRGVEGGSSGEIGELTTPRFCLGVLLQFQGTGGGFSEVAFPRGIEGSRKLPIWHKLRVEGMLGVFGRSANLRFGGRGVVGGLSSSEQASGLGNEGGSSVGLGKLGSVGGLASNSGHGGRA